MLGRLLRLLCRLSPQFRPWRQISLLPRYEHRLQYCVLGVSLMILDSGGSRIMYYGDMSVNRSAIPWWRNLSRESDGRMMFVLSDVGMSEVNCRWYSCNILRRSGKTL